MKQPIKLKIDPELIRPLNKAQNEFIQVLLSSFSIHQGDKGLTLDVEFDNESLAVWLREGKNNILYQLDPGLIKKYQEELESILIPEENNQEKKDWTHNDSCFPFRFGNGGTLPVIRYGDKDYYCFFYRDIPPVGWNIANGGAESISELLDPLATIERELREELIIIDPSKKYWYIFDWVEGQRPDHPDFQIARRVWEEIFKKSDFQDFKNFTLPLKWLAGNDSVVINFNDGKNKVNVSNCFLNINAEDFGIEIDRIAKMTVSKDSILCDGELSGGILLNQVVGLFEVNRFNSAMAVRRKEFFPDLTFWSGQNRSKDNLETVVKEYLEYVVKKGIRTLESCRDWENLKYKYCLCPVTKTLILRYLCYINTPVPEEIPTIPASAFKQLLKVDVFLSFPSEDRELARQVFDYLKNSGHSVFFSDETLHQSNFADEIDDALEAARSFVLVGAKTNLFFKNWVRYEWRSFHHYILSNRKPWETPFVTFTTTPDMDLLPRPLAIRQIIDYSKKSFDESLRDLNAFLKA